MIEIKWPDAVDYITKKRDQRQRTLNDFEGSEFQRGRVAGEVKALSDMLNLPEALALLAEAEKEDEK